MQFVPTLSGEMIRADTIERLAPHDGEPESGNLWTCQTRDGRSHRLTPETVDLMSSTVVPCATGWFVPEELVRGPSDEVVGISKVPIVAWMLHASGGRITPVTVDPELSATGEAVGAPDGRVFLLDGAEFENLEAYLVHLRGRNQ